MPNLQAPGLTDTQKVACAIYCCDQKEYPLVKRAGNKNCQRLGSKKHSCVLHQLREKKGGKLTQKNRFSGIQASPRIEDNGKLLIPDTIVGSTVIDAKFPCPDPIKNTPPNIAQPSPARSSDSMLGTKETVDYQNLDGVDDVEGMTPSEAEDEKGDCKCGKFQ